MPLTESLHSSLASKTSALALFFIDSTPATVRLLACEARSAEDRERAANFLPNFAAAAKKFSINEGRRGGWWSAEVGKRGREAMNF